MTESSELLRLEILRKDLDDVNASYERNIKARRKRELILITTCLIALIYTSSSVNLQNNPEIEIPAISLKILLKDAVAIFPTIIASIYLIYVSTIITQLTMEIVISKIRSQIDLHIQILKFPKQIQLPTMTTIQIRDILLPSPLNTSRLYFTSSISRKFVDVFVGLVFNILPYYTMIFISAKSYQLSNNIYTSIWNIVCTSVMLISFLSILISSSKRQF